MAKLTVEETNNRVVLSTFDESISFDGKAFIIGSIECALGNIVDTLQQYFHISDYTELSPMIKGAFIEKIVGNEVYYDLCGIIRCRKTNLVPIMVFLSENEQETLSLNTVEDFRNGYKLRVYPPDKIEINESISYSSSVANISDIFYVLLWYYAYKGMKLTRCVHCGKWYATDSLKNTYCSRRSPMKKYNHLSCYEATKNCKRDCLRIKNRIETKARQYFDNHYDSISNNSSLQTSPFVYRFQQECENIRNSKSNNAHDLEKYYAFLKETEKNKSWIKE